MFEWSYQFLIGLCRKHPENSTNFGRGFTKISEIQETLQFSNSGTFFNWEILTPNTRLSGKRFTSRHRKISFFPHFQEPLSGNIQLIETPGKFILEFSLLENCQSVQILAFPGKSFIFSSYRRRKRKKKPSTRGNSQKSLGFFPPGKKTTVCEISEETDPRRENPNNVVHPSRIKAFAMHLAFLGYFAFKS